MFFFVLKSELTIESDGKVARNFCENKGEIQRGGEQWYIVCPVEENNMQ